jgi:hypothetical protein
VILPATVNPGKGCSYTFLPEGQPLNQAQGRFVIRHNISFDTMNMIFIKNNRKTLEDTFLRVTLMLVFRTELISQAAAVVGLLQKVLKTDRTDNLIRIIL